MDQSTGFVRVEQQGAVGLITLSRPKQRNALKSAMYGEIADALRAFQDDDAIHVILLSGEGRDFCAGNDIGDFHAFGEIVEETGLDPQSIVGRTTPSIDLVHVLMEIDKPLISCIQGNSVGFGATLLLHCDVVIADPTARLIFPFINLALVPEAGSTLLLKERVGLLKAAEILYNGAAVGCEEAEKIGLVSEIVAEGQSVTRGMEVAHTLAAKPTNAMRATKRLLKRDVEALTDRVTEEFKSIAERTSSDEARSVFAAMLAK